jgi:hydroxymethylbilane synthase
MNSSNKLLRIGTRGSPLALAQAKMVRDQLRTVHDLAEDEVTLAVIKTTGDKVLDRPLADLGGKGLFTKEIEEALLGDHIDLAVHSMKDMPTAYPEGLDVPCILVREDPRDAFLSPRASGLAGLAEGAVVGSASLRRQAQILNQHPGLKVVTLRGNVQTRLAKLERGEVDATLLALAGLKRLGLAGTETAILEIDEMLPAVAQGAIGIECRTGDDRVRGRLAALHHEDTATCIAAERAMLTALDGSCRTPIAGLARLDASGGIHLRALVASPNGRLMHRAERTGDAGDAVAIGADAGAELLARAGPDVFSETG